MAKSLSSKGNAPATQQLLGRATELHQRGRLTEAETLYRDVLRREAGHFEARHLLGVLCGQQGRYEEALDLVGAALKTRPDAVGALSNYGLILLRLKRPGEALAIFGRALALRPDNPEALNNQGNALAQLGRHVEALASYDRALAQRPDHAEALNNRANALTALGRREEALASLARALAHRPDYAEALYNRGNVLSGLERCDEALASFDRALAIRPDYADALRGRADLLAEQKRYTEALSSYQRVVALRPDDADAPYNHGNVLSELKRYEEALASYDAALAARPDHAGALENRGNALSKLRRYEAAVASYEAALALEPERPGTLTNLGTALKNLKRYEEALASYDAALALQPAHADALFGRGNALKEIKRYDESLASYDAALAITRDHPDAFGWVDAALATCDWRRTAALVGELEAELRKGKSVVTPFTLLGLCDDPALHLRCAQNYFEDHIPVRPPPLWAGGTFRNERIRVAYLSADFRGHATSFLMAELFELHDRSRFEIVAVSFGQDDGSDMRRRLVDAFDQFHDVRLREDREVAELIDTLRVDIAVDLKGYTQGARPAILGFRPAPIQVNFLGYPGTMGADFIDYVLADEVVVPFDQQPFYAEKVVHLPDCYQPNDSKRRIFDGALTRAGAGLPADGFVFCCFNNNYKITRDVFDAWMRLLAALPGSVLWLLRDNTAAEANLRAEMQSRGIDPARLIFADRVSLDLHLARHRLADLFLDTLPYNAHTTASDALWAGLPVLTCLGQSFAGRVASSLLQAVGLGELVTHSIEDYEAMARRLAGDQALLGAIRERLRRSKPSCPLFDSSRFCRHIEAAYLRMWRTWQEGAAPRSFSVAIEPMTHR